MKAACALFEEFYYSLEDQAVNKRRRPDRVYRVGEAVPLSGKSFSYPEFFDLVIIREQVAVKIRAGRVTGLLPLGEYRYEGLPVLNERGFAFKVRSRADWQACLEHYAAANADEAALSSRWLDFTAYRNIPFSHNDWVI
jgi:sulfate adenylyltransferase subunit 1